MFDCNASVSRCLCTGSKGFVAACGWQMTFTAVLGRPIPPAMFTSSPHHRHARHLLSRLWTARLGDRGLKKKAASSEAAATEAGAWIRHLGTVTMLPFLVLSQLGLTTVPVLVLSQVQGWYWRCFAAVLANLVGVAALHLQSCCCSLSRPAARASCFPSCWNPARGRC